MLQGGLNKIYPNRRDFSLIPTFGATMADVQSLPDSFSIYDGRQIPDQNATGLPEGCTAESGAFDSGLQDQDSYDPRDLYLNTPPGDFGGRDIRTMLSTLIARGPRKLDGTFGPKRRAYFNCYGTGPIDDFNAAKIGIWINQNERRGVYAGTWWYPQFENIDVSGIVNVPSLNMNEATLHCHLITGFETTYKDQYLETISWQGMAYGKQGRAYISHDIYNKLMAQPYTGAFTTTKLDTATPIPVGVQAEIDHFVYWFRHTLHV